MSKQVSGVHNITKVCMHQSQHFADVHLDGISCRLQDTTVMPIGHILSALAMIEDTGYP